MEHLIESQDCETDFSELYSPNSSGVSRLSETLRWDHSKNLPDSNQESRDEERLEAGAVPRSSQLGLSNVRKTSSIANINFILQTFYSPSINQVSCARGLSHVCSRHDIRPSHQAGVMTGRGGHHHCLEH